MSYGSSVFYIFKGTSILFSIVTVSIYIPTSTVGGSLFSLLQHFLFVDFFDDGGHSDQCEVIPSSSFDLHFSNNEQC